jgi:hypothetical protein
MRASAFSLSDQATSHAKLAEMMMLVLAGSVSDTGRNGVVSNWPTVAIRWKND